MLDPSRTLDLTLAGEPVRLDARRALYWPRRRTLIVADVHLGKDSVFRRAGVAVPSGSTRDDLDRIAALLQHHDAERLLVLGDLFHARLVADEPWFADMDRFRRQHASLQIDVVRGNHDRIDGVPAAWQLKWREEPAEEAPFVLMHDATATRSITTGYALGGHLHPVLNLTTASDRLRLPVFWLRNDHAVLPSFGGFTGGHPIEAVDGDRVIGIAGDRLMTLPNRRR